MRMEKIRYFYRAKDDDWAIREYTIEEHAKIEWFMDVAHLGGSRMLNRMHAQRGGPV